MRFAGVIVSVFVAALAAGVVAFTLTDETAAPESSVLGSTHTPPPPSPTPSATPLPRTWLDGLGPMAFGRGPVLLTCLDRDHNAQLDGRDDPLFFSLALPLSPADSCVNPMAHADYYDAPAPAQFTCGGLRRPVYLVLIGGGGSDLLDASQGDSQGLIGVATALTARAEAAHVSLAFTVSSGAIVGAEMAQTSLEQLLALHVRARLEAMPCARAILIGHSHGGVTVTSATAAIEEQVGDRMLGVIIDRSNVLYDRPAENMPARTRIINVFQTNEGWHGVPLDLPNIVNIDASTATAPIAPADGGGGPAVVTHRSLDDAPEAQTRVVDEILLWLASGP